jgi:hypothetical protein
MNQGARYADWTGSRRAAPLQADGLAAQPGSFKARRLWFRQRWALDPRRLRHEHLSSAVHLLDRWHLEHRIQEALGGGGERVGGPLA